MSKRKSLQPWIDYFKMLHTYEQEGDLEVKLDKHEAYITRAALYTLNDIPPIHVGEEVINGINILDTVRRIRTYVDFLTANSIGLSAFDLKAAYDPEEPLPSIPVKQLKSVGSKPFALHVVKEEAPHDLLCTILLTRRRVWWRLWRNAEQVEVITY